ncbi:MAG: hypothetical protein GY841_14290 [FCB group bacterium]|nr:hypothetical protein [FCB group bacterium]
MDQCSSDEWGRRGLIIGGISLIGIGGFFLMITMGWADFLEDLWPAVLIVLGVALLIGGFINPRAKNDESAS